MATIWSQPSIETLRKLRFGWLMPALFTRMSMRPRRLRISWAARDTSFWSDTSSAIASPLPAALMSFSAFFSVSALRPEMTTCAPARASSMPPASPMPEPPPVIQATLSCRLPLGILGRAEKNLRLLLRERGRLPAPVRQHLDAALDRGSRRNALAPALERRKVLDVHALALGRAQPREDGDVGDAVLVAGDPLAA